MDAAPDDARVEAMLQHDHGPLWYFGLYFHRPTLDALLEVLYTWLHEDAAFLHEPPDLGDWAHDTLADVECQRAFKKAAVSHAVVAAIAPLFETLFRRAACKIRDASGEIPLPTDTGTGSCRSIRGKDYWNPSKFYDLEEEKTMTGFRRGARQLIESIGFGNAVSAGAWEVFDALFGYRNNALHQGYEWESDSIRKFREKTYPAGWFEYCEDGPRLVVVTQPFVVTAIDALEHMARQLRRVEGEIVSRREPGAQVP